MKKVLLSVVVAASPFVVLAAGDLSNVDTFLGNVMGLINTLLALCVALAVLLFFWGLVKYMKNAGDEEKSKEGKSLMIWGIVILFIMASVWGIVGFFKEALIGNNSTEDIIDIPSFEATQ